MKPLISISGFSIESEDGNDDRVGYSDGNAQGVSRFGDQRGGNLLGRKVQGLHTRSGTNTLVFNWDLRGNESYQGALARLHVTGLAINRFFDPWDAVYDTGDDSRWTWQITAPELFVDGEEYAFTCWVTKNKDITN